MLKAARNRRFFFVSGWWKTKGMPPEAKRDEAPGDACLESQAWRGSWHMVTFTVHIVVDSLKGDKRPELTSLPPIVTFMVIYGGHGEGHTSKLRTPRALVSMKLRRDSTTSPINVTKISSAAMASSICTLSSRRTCGSSVVSHN